MEMPSSVETQHVPLLVEHAQDDRRRKASVMLLNIVLVVVKPKSVAYLDLVNSLTDKGLS